MFEVHASQAMATKGAPPLFVSKSLSEVEGKAARLKLKFKSNVVILHRPPVTM